MTKLSDTQLIVLSSAAKHDEGLATRPASLNPAAAMKVASSLIAKGLAREIRAKADAPVWRENDDGRFALKITKVGREAIGVEDEEAQGAASAAAASLSFAGISETMARPDDASAATSRMKRKPTPCTVRITLCALPSSQSARRADLMRLESAESETILPLQIC